MHRIIVLGIVFISFGKFSCSDVINTRNAICEPKCGEGLECRSGICQPIICSQSRTCPSQYLCYEGRCVTTCDGQAPCQSGICEEGLCTGEMDCQNGDIRNCETECGEGVERCIDYIWSACSSGLPSISDICDDGQDNDCDEDIDEGCPTCEDGLSRPCENECGVGEQACTAGHWSICSVPPPDGSGLCPCQEGSFERCETPCGIGQRTCDQGVFGTCLYDGTACECVPDTIEECEAMCGSGQRICENGIWSSCQGAEPLNEICNNRIDEDCDQQVDEGCVECLAVRLNQNDFYASLSGPYQSVPLATSGSLAWLSWYSGSVTRRAYAQGFRIENRQIEKNEQIELPINNVQDIVSIGGGNFAQVGIESQDTIHINYLGSSGLSSSLSFASDQVITQSTVVGESASQIVVYLSDHLYAKKIERNNPENSLPIIQLSTKVNHLGHDVVWGGDRVTVMYQDDTGDFPQGRVLSLIQMSSDGRTVIKESTLNHPSTGEAIFVSSKPAVIFKSNQYLVVYLHKSNRVDHLYSIVLNLEGDIISGPNLLVKSSPDLPMESLDLSTNNQHRGLVWHEKRYDDDYSEIKYMRIDPNGLSSSDVKVIVKGNMRIFPQIEWNNLGRFLVSWTQTDIGGEFGSVLPTIRLGEFNSNPNCQ